VRPEIDRGEVWLVDLGTAAKTRPCLVFSVPPEVPERSVAAIVEHTTAVRGTRFEVMVAKSFLRTGAFDAQGIVTVPVVKFIRKLGELTPEELRTVEEAVKRWLGFD
jgi:mRNA interferase MazF